MVEGTAAERAPAEHPAGGQYSLLAPDATLVKICPQFRGTADGEVLSEDQADAVGFLLVDDKLSILDVIAERYGTAHPHALASRGRELVADALARHLTLELGEREQDIEGESPHRGRGIELLGDGHKRHAMGLEQLDQLGEVGERPGQAI